MQLGESLDESLLIDAPKKKPSTYLVHAALIITQLCFGGGSVVGSLGLANDTNPVLFAMIREICAGFILLVASLCYTRGWEVNVWKDGPRFLLCGLCLFSNQVFFIVGLNLCKSPTTAAVWQPSQPVFALVLGMCMGIEKGTLLKFVGILFAVGGAVFVVTMDTHSKGLSNDYRGHVCFVLNCLGTALYVIFAKPLLKKYASITVTALSYGCAAVQVTILTVILNQTPSAKPFLCPDGCDLWAVPTSAIWALAYWIVFNSVLAYALMTWANQFTDASIVCVYSALQPITAAALSALLLALGVKGLKGPGLNDLGAIGIVIGLAFVLYEDLKKKKDNNDSDYNDDEDEDESYYPSINKQHQQQAYTPI